MNTINDSILSACTDIAPKQPLCLIVPEGCPIDIGDSIDDKFDGVDDSNVKKLSSKDDRFVLEELVLDVLSRVRNNWELDLISFAGWKTARLQSLFEALTGKAQKVDEVGEVFDDRLQRE
ncbi:hypothetical protein K2173_017558 [Erythroxylum novogranatense]|uniref:Uncharacterized protein n=1 Tax=Erythroxylum novogranatense TaxID=1862640 RepID=A0AAV8T998_9ROSI|nr:hypothetical protein K2173_017558 [Erythroxylum novogranatense]